MLHLWIEPIFNQVYSTPLHSPSLPPQSKRALREMQNVREILVHVKQNIDGQDPIAVEKLQIIVKELSFFLFSDEGMEGFLSFESH